MTILGGVCRWSEVKFIVAVHCFLAKLKEEHVSRDFGLGFNRQSSRTSHQIARKSDQKVPRAMQIRRKFDDKSTKTCVGAVWNDQGPFGSGPRYSGTAPEREKAASDPF